MNLQEVVTNGGGILLILMTLVQIAPIEVNPWSAIGRWIGRAINGDVIKRLDLLESRLTENSECMDKHIHMDDERNADLHRYRILRFNTDILRGLRHTEEEFNEILCNINHYEQYCKAHPDYENNRAVLAIENIERVYRERMENSDFL